MTIHFHVFLDVFLFLGSDIPYLSCTTGWPTKHSCVIDGPLKHGEGKLEINGNTYEKGIVAHAPGNATFLLGGLYDKFTTCIGISKLSTDDRCGVSAGDARFRVLGDDKQLRDWEVKSSPENPTCFELEIKNVNELILESDLNISRDCDLSTWAYASVTRKVIAVLYQISIITGFSRLEV